MQTAVFYVLLGVPTAEQRFSWIPQFFFAYPERSMLALRAVCLWPGLPVAWIRGEVRSLSIALAFAWSVCLLLLATFVWPQWIEAGVLRISWCLLILTWSASTVRNLWRLPAMLQITDSHASEAFVKAQAGYLRGDWFDAEAILLEILQQHPRDAEALLLLIGVLRHSQRLQPALRRLKQLELLDTSLPWQFEISREKSLIERAIAESCSA